MTALNDTTQTSQTFPYKFGLDFLQTKVIIFNTINQRTMSLSPSELQQRAADPTLDPHRSNLYKAALDYWQSQQRRS